MNHLQFVQGESYVSPQEHRWEAWLGRVEALVGRPFDLLGEESELAHDAFLALQTPEQYAAEVKGVVVR